MPPDESRVGALPGRKAPRHPLHFGRANQLLREELVKHWHCLERQREYYSEKAITDVEAALGRLMSEVDRLCAQEHGDQLVSQLLRKIDGVTRLSAWSDRQKTH